jgi:putative ABC transport system substrate-binding protein
MVAEIPGEVMLARRRALAALGLGVLVPPFPAFAQRDKVWRIGFLVAGSSPQAFRATGRADAFLHGLRELGYVEGKNLAIEFRFAEGKYERLAEMAAKLVELNVDAIVAGASPAIRAAQRATRTIPIVMVATADPVGSGFVVSLARPGGNTTGLSGGSTVIRTKYVELLMAAVPRLSSVAVLGNPGSSSLPAHPRGASVSRAEGWPETGAGGYKNAAGYRAGFRRHETGAP